MDRNTKIRRTVFLPVLAKFISRVLLENVAKIRGSQGLIAFPRRSSYRNVTREPSKFSIHDNSDDSSWLVVSRELARIPCGLVTSRSFARLIVSLEIASSFFFSFSFSRNTDRWQIFRLFVS